ncbi:MAG: PspC domain-containing protein [Leeuwenhoekiella sp.]
MNKTVNINLAGLFFHIDENAFDKLQRYIDAIKRSFTDAQGRDEIIRDIEARIAELFSERIKSERQVIGLTEVDEVISIMGQPEDYQLDEDIFEDEPQPSRSTTTTKKLYRDMDESWIGGVCAGLGHYLAIDAVWIRIILVLLTVFSWGGFVLIYILFWIFVPAAVTTSEKLEMRGKPVNIDNIQRKVKEGFEDVANTVKNVDYQKYGNQAKKGATSLGEGIGKFIMLLFTIIAKIFGVFLIIIGATTVIGLFIGLFTAGTIDIFDASFGDYIDLVNRTIFPIWFVMLMVFFAVGIPFFFLFYLGLKILVNTAKRMSLTAKLTFLGLWLVSIGVLIALGVSQAFAYSERGSVQETETLYLSRNDTLEVTIADPEGLNTRWDNRGWEFYRDASGDKNVKVNEVDLFIHESKDDSIYLKVNKRARSHSAMDAAGYAENITYDYELNGNKILLTNYLSARTADKFRDQDVRVDLYIPERLTFILNDSQGYTRSFEGRDFRTWWQYNNKRYQIINGNVTCLDCPEQQENTDFDTEDTQDVQDTLSASGSKYDYDAAIKTKPNNAATVLEEQETATDTLR